jgi:ankyrin repeat protein
MSRSGADDRDDLFRWAAEGAAGEIERLVAAGADPNAVDENGETPLHFACDRGQLEAVRALLLAGADPNAREEQGQTPLMYAVVCECDATADIADLLIRAGADVEAKDNDGVSPLEQCSEVLRARLQRAAEVV